MLRAGHRIGPYELLSPIGAGGMGEVWKACDTRLDRSVAVKFSQAAFTDRFQQEARAIAALNHPNLATLYDVDPDYLVMEFIDGDPIKPPKRHPLRLSGRWRNRLLSRRDGRSSGLRRWQKRPAGLFLRQRRVWALAVGRDADRPSARHAAGGHADAGRSDVRKINIFRPPRSA